jgi:phage-related protein
MQLGIDSLHKTLHNEGAGRVPTPPVKVGGGPPPGYLWNADVLDCGHEEAMDFLDTEQYAHLAAQVRELATQDDPTHSETIDVRENDGFYEIRDKGGALGKINARVFFFVRKSSRKIVVLGAINKKNDGQTPIGDRRRMQRRMKIYLSENPE